METRNFKRVVNAVNESTTKKAANEVKKFVNNAAREGGKDLTAYKRTFGSCVKTIFAYIEEGGKDTAVAFIVKSYCDLRGAKFSKNGIMKECASEICAALNVGGTVEKVRKNGETYMATIYASENKILRYMKGEMLKALWAKFDEVKGIVPEAEEDIKNQIATIDGANIENVETLAA